MNDEDTQGQPERADDPFDRIAEALERIAAALERQVVLDQEFGTITISGPVSR